MAKQNKISVLSVVGKGYEKFWHDRHRYRVVKGGRGSKKSATMALWLINSIMKYPLANAMCVRKTGNTHKDSTFAQLQWAAQRFGVFHLWNWTMNPLEATYKPTGQKILFRGFDDPLKLTSITVPKGVLCWVWIEEAYEIEDEQEFATLDESIRGEMPEGLWKQITLTFNPWINSHWTKKRFFDRTDPEAFTLTTTYKCNEWLDEADRKLIESLEKTDPDRYKVVGLGEYGIPGGTYFEEFRSNIHVIQPFELPSEWRRYRAFDYGLDMLACYWIAIDTYGRAYVYKELYEGKDSGMDGHIVSSAAKRIKEMTNEPIYQTIAPPDLRNRQKDTGDSIADTFAKNGIRINFASNNRVQGWYLVKEWLKPFQDELGETTIAQLRIFNNCTNLIRCLSQVTQDKNNPNDVSDTPHELTHAPDAIRYFVSYRVKATESGSEDSKDKKRRNYNLFGGNAGKSLLGGSVRL